MKKLLMLTALCALVVSFTGCGNENTKNENLNNEVNSGIVVSPLPEENQETELKPEGTETPDLKPEETQKPVEDLPATKPSKQPEVTTKPSKEPEATSTPDVPVTKPDENVETGTEKNPDDGIDEEGPQLDAELDELVNYIVKQANIGTRALFNAMITADASSTYVGLTDTEYNSFVEKGIANESMMMPSNYSFCILKLKNGTNVDDVKQKIFDNCNPRKWICMGAQYVLVVDSGDYVALVMSTKENCQAISEALKNKLGTIGTTLEREVID